MEIRIADKSKIKEHNEKYFESLLSGFGSSIEPPTPMGIGVNESILPAYDPIKVWQSYTKGRVSGKSIDCGHFIPEEKPNETINEIINFLESINYN